MMYSEAIKAIEAITREHRDYMASALRYARFMTTETPHEWAALLGPDVVLLTHGEYTAEVARHFYDDGNSAGGVPTMKEQRLLHIVCLIHDWGEIVIGADGVGDISFDQKTATHEDAETIMFDRVVSSIANVRVRNYLRGIYREVAMDRTSRLGKMFNAIERLGYLRTAIRAFCGTNDGQRIINWRGLVGNVLANQIEPLLAYAQMYPGVSQFLRSHALEITQMFDDVSSHSVPDDRDGNASFSIEKLLQAREAWKCSNYAVACEAENSPGQE